MNITPIQFVEGFERIARELLATIAEWPVLEDVLVESYFEDIAWALSSRAEVIQRAQKEGAGSEVRRRLYQASLEFVRLHDLLVSIVGIPSELILDTASLTEGFVEPLVLACDNDNDFDCAIAA